MILKVSLKVIHLLHAFSHAICVQHDGCDAKHYTGLLVIASYLLELQQNNYFTALYSGLDYLG